MGMQYLLRELLIWDRTNNKRIEKVGENKISTFGITFFWLI